MNDHWGKYGQWLSRSLLVIALLIPVLMASAQEDSVVISGKFTPPPGQTLLIVGQDLGAIGGLPGYTDGYTDHVAQVPGGLTTYVGLHDLAGLETRANWGSGDNHVQLIVEEPRYVHSVLVIGLSLTGVDLEDAAAGKHDTRIDALGTWIKARDRPVFLRIGYEFDGAWNAYEPTAYVATFRRIVDRFAALDVTNCATVWQSATDSSGRYNGYAWLDWYPGDEYVDWFGLSYFNPSAFILNSWLDLAREHGKPVMIAESTPRGNDLALTERPDVVWRHWFLRYFDFIYENADVIRAVAYINVNWQAQPMWQSNPVYWGDSRVQANSDILAWWETEIAQPFWLPAGPELFAQLGYPDAD